MVTYNVMMDIAFAVKECKDPDGKTVTPQQIREAILTRLALLDDEELKEAVGVCDSYEEDGEPCEVDATHWKPLPPLPKENG